MYINEGGDIGQLRNGFLFPKCSKIYTKHRKIDQLMETNQMNKTSKKNKKIKEKFIDLMFRKGIFMSSK